MKKAFIIRIIKLHTKPLRLIEQTLERVSIKKETSSYYIMEDGRKIKKSTVVYFKEL